MFSAAGTAGQRCTTMRRVIAHSSVVDTVVDRVAAAYEKLPIGSPFDSGTLVGPLVNGRAHDVVRVGRLRRDVRRRHAGRRWLAGAGR